MAYNPGLQRAPNYATGPAPPTVTPPSTTASPIVVIQAGHTFAVGEVVYGAIGTGFAKGRSDAINTLGRYVVSAITANSFSLARPGDIVGGYTGLIPYEWYHTSPTVAGGLVPSGTGQVPSGCVAANPIGQAISATELLIHSFIPYEV